MFGHTSGNNMSADVVLGGDRPVVKGVRTKERWYFINFLAVDKNGILKNPMVIKGRIYNMPPLGGAFEVDSVTAVDLIDRLRVYDPKLGYVDGATKDPMVARAVLAAFKSGTLNSIASYSEVIRNGMVDSLTDEQLEAALARRRALKEIQLPEVAGDTVIAATELVADKSVARVADKGAK